MTEKDNWRKYPSDMLFARAISRGARRFAPGIFGGSPVYTPDEMGVDTNEEGMIEAVVVDHEPLREKIYVKDVNGAQVSFDAPQEPPEDPSPDDDISLPAPKMTLEQARMVKGGKDGKLYGDLDKNDLVGKMIGLKEMLKKELAPEKREEALFKLEAARMLRANFDKQSATPE